jgi:sec-independent protein translocase protein TatA
MFPNLGPLEMLIVGAVAVLLFGKRLPEVGRSLGKGIVEFKKGLRGIEDELDLHSTMSSTHAPSRRSEDRSLAVESSETAVPKFEPPTSTPAPHMDYGSPHPAEG